MTGTKGLKFNVGLKKIHTLSGVKKTNKRSPHLPGM